MCLNILKIWFHNGIVFVRVCGARVSRASCVSRSVLIHVNVFDIWTQNAYNVPFRLSITHPGPYVHHTRSYIPNTTLCYARRFELCPTMATRVLVYTVLYYTVAGIVCIAREYAQVRADNKRHSPCTTDIVAEKG